MSTRKHKNYNVDEVLKSLSRKKDIVIRPFSYIIHINIGEAGKNAAAKDIGIRSKGKIDFLTNYCGYSKQYLDFKFLK